MNKAELIGYLSEKVGVTKKQAEDMVESFVDVVTSTLKNGGEVNIAGFGAFMAKTRAARMGVNPATGEKIKIAAKTVVKFRLAKAAKDAVL